MALHLRFGRRFGRNGWKARTLDWAMPTRPTSYGFASLPTIDRRADDLDPDELGPRLAAGEGYLGFVRDNRMETLAVDMTTGRLEHLVVLPKPTFMPLVSASLTGMTVLAMLFKIYPLAAILAIATVGSFLFWPAIMGSERDEGTLPVGRGEYARRDTEVERPSQWWAMVFALAANGTLFVSLLFGTLYLWLVAPGWPPAEIVEPGLWLWLTAPLLILASIVWRWSAGINARGGNFVPAAILAIALDAAAIIVISLRLAGLPDPTQHAHLATSAALLGYAALHAGVGLVFSINALMKNAGGYVSARRGLSLRLASLWHDYTAVTGVVVVAMIALMPGLIGVLAEVG
jgi:cytochrome c oxidase subunit I+III